MTTEATLDTIATPVDGTAPISTPSAAQGAATLYAETPVQVAAPAAEAPAAAPEKPAEPASLATGAEPSGEAKPAEPAALEAPVLTAESYIVSLPDGMVLDDA